MYFAIYMKEIMLCLIVIEMSHRVEFLLAVLGDSVAVECLQLQVSQNQYISCCLAAATDIVSAPPWPPRVSLSFSYTPDSTVLSLRQPAPGSPYRRTALWLPEQGKPEGAENLHSWMQSSASDAWAWDSSLLHLSGPPEALSFCRTCLILSPFLPDFPLPSPLWVFLRNNPNEWLSFEWSP